MVADYPERVRAETSTRLWVNNPTPDEVGLALAVGRAGGTTNPTFSANRLRPDRERGVALAAVDEETAETNSDDDTDSIAQRLLVARVASLFLPFQSSGGTEGFVSIQGSPETDENAVAIVADGVVG